MFSIDGFPPSHSPKVNFSLKTYQRNPGSCKMCFVDMSLDDIRAYEKKMHTETNKKVGIESVPSQSPDPSTPSNTPASNTPEEKDK